MYKTIIKCKACKENFAHYKRTKGGKKKEYCEDCGRKINNERCKKRQREERNGLQGNNPNRRGKVFSNKVNIPLDST